MKIRTLGRLGIVVNLLLLASCNGHWQSAALKPEGGCWNVKDTLRLSFESLDTVNAYALSFPLTVSEDYPYNNVYLQATLVSPSGDTAMIPAEFVLTGPSGAWLTEVNGDLATFQLNVGDAIIFKQSGKYAVSLLHYMREGELCGVQSVGVAIDPLPPANP